MTARQNREIGSGGDVALPVLPEKLTYREASAELDGIVAALDRPDVDLDELVPMLKRALGIVDELNRRIRTAKMQVDVLVPQLQAAGTGGGVAEAGDDGGVDSNERVTEEGSR